MNRDYLFIYLDGADDLYPWRKVVREGTVTGGIDTLETINAQAIGAAIVVLLPGSEVLLTEVQAPTRQRKRLLQAIPYLLEEQLASEPEQLHFALGPDAGDGRFPVAVIERERMGRLRDRFQHAELRVALATPLLLTLPLHDGCWSLHIGESMAYLRTDRWHGIAIDNDNLAAVLALLASQNADNLPPGIVLTATRAELLEQYRTVVEHLIPLLESRVVDPLELCVEGFDEAQQLNLMQGDFSRREQLGKLWRPWRAVAALALVWLVSELSLGISEYRQLSAEETALYAKLEKTFLTAFPGSRVVDPKLQMERKLADLSGGADSNGFITLLNSSAPVFSGAAGFELQSLRFNGGNLEVEIKIRDLPALDQLKSALTQRGLAVEIQTATSRSDGVNSRLRISGGAA